MRYRDIVQAHVPSANHGSSALVDNHPRDLIGRELDVFNHSDEINQIRIVVGEPYRHLARTTADASGAPSASFSAFFMRWQW